MKRRFKNMAVTALVCGGLVAQAAPAFEPDSAAAAPSLRGKALSLAEALDLASSNNPQLKAARARVEADAGRAYQARQWSNPELEVASEEIPVRSGSFEDSKNTIGISQTVPWPGKKKLDGQIGSAGVRLTEADLQLQWLNTARNVKAAFYRVLASEQLVGVAKELVSVAESFAGAARKRVEAGAAADQEQLRAEIQLDQARTELAGMERELAEARQDLVTFLGRPDLLDTPVAGALAQTSDPAALALDPEQWLAKHPILGASHAARERARLELRRARLEPYPDVRLGVDGGREGPDNNAIVEFRISVPLPILDRSKGRKREAQANVDAAEAELASAEQILLREWGKARKRYLTAVEQATAYGERILPKAVDALRLVQTGFEEGKFTFIDLLDTQRTTAEARLQYQQKLLDLNIAHAELEALLGRVSATELKTSATNR